jgi:hypothetical protein
MSDTPRTDAAEWEVEFCHPECKADFASDRDNYGMAVPSVFARQLERELISVTKKKKGERLMLIALFLAGWFAGFIASSPLWK